MTKTCTKCKLEYPATSEYFTSNKRGKNGLHSWCRKCTNKQSRDWKHNNSEKATKHNHNWYLKNKKKCNEDSRKSRLRLNYGLTATDYNRMFEQQNGCCAICGRHQSGLSKRLCVDHDHKTDEVRGLLCSNCNSGLGYFKDCKEFLVQAISYL